MTAWLKTTRFVLLSGILAVTLGGCGGIVDEGAEARFMDKLGDMSITVFPAFVRDGEQHRYAPDQAATVGDFLTQEKLATVALSTAEVPITSEWGMNQAKMLRGSAEDFSAYVRENSLETDYAMLAEYLIGGNGTPVGVHLYVVDAGGTVAYGMLTNSHHQVFTDVNPQTVGDCTQIVVNSLREDLATDDTAKQARKASPALSADSALTIVPVMLAGNASKEVADAVGLILEKEGMPNISTTDADFRPPTDASVEKTAELFAEFTRRNPVEGDCALFADFRGKPGVGVDEVRGILVNRAGEVIWTDRQTPTDADFKRIKPRNPMTCCVLLTERLKPVFHLDELKSKPTGEGRMARLWAEKSGTPTDEQRAAMSARVEQMKASLANSTVLVYPALVNAQAQRENAERMRELVAAEFKCAVLVAEDDLRIEVAPNSNEQKRLWDLAKSFRQHVRQSKPDADYAVYPEYTIRPRDGKVWAVHFVVCNRAGQWVIVDFQNEYQPDFKRIQPKNTNDCDRLVIRRLSNYLN